MKICALILNIVVTLLSIFGSIESIAVSEVKKTDGLDPIIDTKLVCLPWDESCELSEGGTIVVGSGLPINSKFSSYELSGYLDLGSIAIVSPEEFKATFYFSNDSKHFDVYFKRIIFDSLKRHFDSRNSLLKISAVIGIKITTKKESDIRIMAYVLEDFRKLM